MSISHFDAPPADQLEGEALADRVRAAAELLESIAEDRSVLAAVPQEDRTRLLRAAGLVSRPDAVARRQLVKEAKRQRKVERVHADKPGAPLGLADVLTEFWVEMQQHMMKEERVLFPMLRAGARGPQVYMPVRVMEHEHDEHAAHLEKIRELTSNLEIPPHACATWTALYRGLRALEAELLEHIHLENNVLFPRAAGNGPG